MADVRALGLAIVLACGSPPAPVTPPPIAARADAAMADAPAVSDDEKLAAIQKAMNELAPVVQQCWASVAVVRFDVEGELTAQIDIGPPNRVAFVRDTTKNRQLAACVQAVLEAYPWAPPLRGQAIQLPFAVHAPGGQSVIDRRLVPFAGQGKVSVAVLLDENNTGNANASMFELAIAAGGTTGLRTAPRAELWWLQGEAELRAPALPAVKLAAGSLFYVPAGGAREVRALTGDVHAVIVVAPGGPEGAARAGALPTPELTTWRRAPVKPVILAKPIAAKGHDIYLDATIIKDAPFSAAIATIPKGVTIAEHVHAKETELIYTVAGSGTLTVGGIALQIDASSVAQIPPNTKHAFTSTAEVRMLQLYTPAGPEQRFK